MKDFYWKRRFFSSKSILSFSIKFKSIPYRPTAVSKYLFKKCVNDFSKKKEGTNERSGEGMIFKPRKKRKC